VSSGQTVGLAAGSALVGKVGIDQTTPGTTNKVSIGTDGTVTVNAHAVTNAGTFAVQLPDAGTGQAVAVGKTAADSAIAASPVTVGGRASAVVPTAMSADGDVVNAWLDRLGAIIMRSPGEVAGWYANGDYTGAQTNTALKTAGGSGLSHYITDLVVTNDATAAITVKLLDGSGGTNMTGTHKIAVSGGMVVRFQTPIKLTANTALCVTTGGTSNFSVLVTGYTAP
jgi:hypothetical protein